MNFLSDYMNDKQTDLFKKTGSFFAFGDKQFQKARVEGVTYVNCGAGLLCPKQTVEELINGLDSIYDQAVRQDVEENGAEKIIEREYFNHETQISCDRSAALEAIDGHRKRFPELFTDQLIATVMHQCFTKAVENNWF